MNCGLHTSHNSYIYDDLDSENWYCVLCITRPWVGRISSSLKNKGGY